MLFFFFFFFFFFFVCVCVSLAQIFIKKKNNKRNHFFKFHLENICREQDYDDENGH